MMLANSTVTESASAAELSARRLSWVGGLLLILSGCSDAGAEGATAGRAAVGPITGQTPPSAGITQGGAQDFGAFREVVEAGEIPAPNLLDDVGFFNEHKIEFPDADCGEDICAHGSLGVMGNFVNGANCTMVFVGMNTSVNPSELERKPLNLAIAVDTSGSMQGRPMLEVQAGLELMLPHLTQADRISLVAFSDEARVVAQNAGATSPDLAQGIETLVAAGGTNIYAGLETAYELVQQAADGEHQNRVVLLSDGVATVGFTSQERLLALSAGHSREGILLSTIGLGTEFDLSLMRELSVSGAGAFYFVEEPAALREVFTEEVRTFMVPLATDAQLELSVSSDYVLRGMYGALNSEVFTRRASVDMPALQIAHRVSVADDELGRRGGGGVMIAELVPDADSSEAQGEVGQLELSYLDRAGERVTQRVEIESPLAPGETPKRGYFEDASVEKSFVMLNLYAGMRMALEDAQFSDFAGAAATLSSLEVATQDWLSDNPDPDIEDDLHYLQLLRTLIDERAAREPKRTAVQPRAPWPAD